MASVHEVIEAFRKAPSNAERGAKFEQLMVRYFQLDPLMQERYDQVWRWADWPDRDSTDVGIDLVARERGSGELTAIQCKFYEPTHTLAKGDIDSFFTASGKRAFTDRIIISTTDRWGSNAEAALGDQHIPVKRLSLAEIADSPINWDIAWPNEELQVSLETALRHELRPHQQQAIDKVFDGLATSDRGKLIMACGTGKTFTALKAAERWASENGGSARVLFLVPSISLLSQTMREWSAQSRTRIRSFAVCSDSKAARAAEDISPYDAPQPPTTDPAKLAAQMGRGDDTGGLTVLFSTYHSLPVVSQAQELGVDDFDLIICDEAHRTTGVTLQGDDESNFVKIHDNDFVRGGKRLYMTATPRIYDENVKAKAEEHSAVTTSMDDEGTYGPEFHRLNFGAAVEKGLLTDYKVLVLTVDEDYIAGPLQEQVADGNREISLDDAAKIVGCWNGLAKRAGQDMDGNGFPPGQLPMKRAVAFLRDIESSKRFSHAFESVVHAYDGADEDALECSVHHVDGSFNALQRNQELSWLKAPVPDGECRILSNARCLSEGVDVPALDSVMFLNPRNSVVDVVQSVGRVMRRAEHKDYGYIVLPVAVPSGTPPEKALADNKRFKVVWQVLNALRAHDDRFNAMVNSIELNKGSTEPGEKGNDQLLGGHIGPTDENDASLVSGNEAGTETGDTGADGAESTAGRIASQAALFSLGQWRDAIYARIVKNVGTRAYWEDWATSVADIADAQQTRIRTAVHGSDTTIRTAFANFVRALRHNLNDSISEDDAISMLAQHLITKPVFDALFENYSFATHNPVSRVMQEMLDTLDGQGLEAETRDLDEFYDSVRVRASGVTSASGKQTVITELYERFFKLAFAKQAESLGIVYTPVQIVDFLLRAANDVLNTEFGQSLSDEGVHVLDGFTGTGTFIVRLIESGIIKPEDLARKYASELHANEIMLLAYYIAAVNIEATYHGIVGGEYQPFGGIALTDTFQISEAGDSADTSLFPANNARIEGQLNTPIRVIVGNPPYSVGQNSANDNNANLKYPTLDRKIADTYVARSVGKNPNSLYDSYIRAIRWGTDRIEDQGIVAYVSNGGWLDSNTADGLRLSLVDEFSSLYVYNLRGNQRTSGEQSRREGGKVFGSGSRSTVAILVAVKNPQHTGSCQIFYRDIGDYLSREEKLATVQSEHLATIDWSSIAPNKDGDWINQRNDIFTTYPAIGDKKNKHQITLFKIYSRGLETTRDAWVYNYSSTTLESSVASTVNFFNAEAERYEQEGGNATPQDFVNTDSGQISWSSSLTPRIAQGVRLKVEPAGFQGSIYRPFSKQHVYFDADLNHRRGELTSMFPTSYHENEGFYVVGAGSDVPFSAVMLNVLPNLHVTGAGSGGQFFPRWTYVQVDSEEGQLDFAAADTDEWGYRRVDNITDAIHGEYRSAFGDQVSKDDIFYYVYSLLHSPQYREAFAADLKKMLPRIPKPDTRAKFETFVDSGRRLAELHVNYEAVEPYPLEERIHGSPKHGDRELWRVTKMKWKSKGDRSAIVYNGNLTLGGIPDDAHRFMLGSRSALDWLIDRYQIKTDKPSGIVNDPNDWCDEHDDPRYIVDLIKRVTTVSVETMKIVDNLPILNFE